MTTMMMIMMELKPVNCSRGLLYQNKVKCSAFDMEMIFHFHANKTHFHKKGCALGFILKVRVFGTGKWPFVDLKHFRHPSDEQLRLIDTLYFKQQQFAICPL